MKKHLLFTAIAALGISLSANAQCKVVQDTVIAGAQKTQESTYYYDLGLKITVVETIDSNSTTVTKIDSLFYDGSDRLTNIDSYDLWGGPASLYGTTTFSYNGSGQISRIAKWGDNGNGPWTMAHDLTYSSGELQSVKLDPFSITGQPEGFMANFENMVWTNGNVTYVELIGDLGGGMDTLELNVSFDNKNNLEAQLYIREAPDMIMHLSQNNVETIVFQNDEAMGNAGTVALQYSYTYNSNNDVVTRAELPGLFESELSTNQYNWDCALPGAGVEELENNSFNIYPNPFSNSFTVKNDDFEIRNASAKVMDLNGRVIRTFINVESGTILDLGDLDAGLYILSIDSKGGKSTQRIIKE